MAKELERYMEQFSVRQTDCDPNGWMLPGALLRLCQQIATDHCDQLGLTSEFYQRTHTAFLLAKQALEWKRIPTAREELTLCTRPEVAKRAVYKRITEVRDAAGEEIALVDSRWVLVDTQTRHILRHPPQEFFELPFSEEVERELSMRMPRTKETEAAGVAMAGYSRCDINGHLNNTRYVDIACDALPFEELMHSPVRSLCINHHNELPLGRECRLERAQLEPGVWYVSGRSAEKQCFETVLTLK